jgi:hypothetical protein
MRLDSRVPRALANSAVALLMLVGSAAASRLGRGQAVVGNGASDRTATPTSTGTAAPTAQATALATPDATTGATPAATVQPTAEATAGATAEPTPDATPGESAERTADADDRGDGDDESASVRAAACRISHYPRRMIVVIGNPVLRREGATSGKPTAAGMAALVAAATAAAGSQVQLVGRTGDDPAGDELVLALTRAGVGHAALQRVRRTTPVVAEREGTESSGPAGADEAGVGESPSSTVVPDIGFDAADVDLAMRYLPDIRVVVISPEVATDVASVAARAGGWSGATTIRLVAGADEGREDFPHDSIVLSVPANDHDGAFATLVGQYAAALDRGDDTEGAFRRVVGGTGWTPATE